jgi:hypothetical protein
MTSKVAQARNALSSLIEQMEADGYRWTPNKLRSILEILQPNPSIRRAPRRVVQSAPMTQELADQVRAYKAEKPYARQADIGRTFRINQGEVSKVLRGLIFPPMSRFA